MSSTEPNPPRLSKQFIEQADNLQPLLDTVHTAIEQQLASLPTRLYPTLRSHINKLYHYIAVYSSSQLRLAGLVTCDINGTIDQENPILGPSKLAESSKRYTKCHQTTPDTTDFKQLITSLSTMEEQICSNTHFLSVRVIYTCCTFLLHATNKAPEDRDDRNARVRNIINNTSMFNELIPYYHDSKKNAFLQYINDLDFPTDNTSLINNANPLVDTTAEKNTPMKDPPIISTVHSPTSLFALITSPITKLFGTPHSDITSDKSTCQPSLDDSEISTILQNTLIVPLSTFFTNLNFAIMQKIRTYKNRTPMDTIPEKNYNVDCDYHHHQQQNTSDHQHQNNTTGNTNDTPSSNKSNNDLFDKPTSRLNPRSDYIIKHLERIFDYNAIHQRMMPYCNKMNATHHLSPSYMTRDHNKYHSQHDSPVYTNRPRSKASNLPRRTSYKTKNPNNTKQPSPKNKTDMGIDKKGRSVNTLSHSENTLHSTTNTQSRKRVHTTTEIADCTTKKQKQQKQHPGKETLLDSPASTITEPSTIVTKKTPTTRSNSSQSTNKTKNKTTNKSTKKTLKDTPTKKGTIDMKGTSPKSTGKRLPSVLRTKLQRKNYPSAARTKPRRKNNQAANTLTDKTSDNRITSPSTSEKLKQLKKPTSPKPFNFSFYNNEPDITSPRQIRELIQLTDWTDKSTSATPSTSVQSPTNVLQSSTKPVDTNPTANTQHADLTFTPTGKTNSTIPSTPITYHHTNIDANKETSISPLGTPTNAANIDNLNHSDMNHSLSHPNDSKKPSPLPVQLPAPSITLSPTEPTQSEDVLAHQLLETQPPIIETAINTPTCPDKAAAYRASQLSARRSSKPVSRIRTPRPKISLTRTSTPTHSYTLRSTPSLQNNKHGHSRPPRHP
jgi:hypothetical protein